MLATAAYISVHVAYVVVPYGYVLRLTYGYPGYLSMMFAPVNSFRAEHCSTRARAPARAVTSPARARPPSQHRGRAARATAYLKVPISSPGRAPRPVLLIFNACSQLFASRRVSRR